jgi:acetyl-CoA carboxylase biotin carboxyl carrier protein
MARHSIDEGVIERLVKLLDEHGLTELEYGEGRWHVRVSRAGAGHAVAAPPPPPRPESEEPDTSATRESAAAHPGAVTSPMVGTVYLAPEPGAEPYVQIGDTVGEGQTLLLIEAMKTMNPICAHRPGRVSQIFAQNASPVEYGEVLVILE